MPPRVSSPRFVGRTAELATLDAARVRAADGHSAAVLVAGDAGMGKSRLVAEFERRAQAAGAEVLVGECVELTEGELPYGPIVAALRPLVRPADGGPITTLHPAVRGALARLWPELADAGSGAQDEFARGQLFEAVHRLDRRARGREARGPDRRGPALGRPLDASRRASRAADRDPR